MQNFKALADLKNTKKRFPFDSATFKNVNYVISQFCSV